MMNDERDRRDEDPGQPSENQPDADGSTQEWPVASEPARGADGDPIEPATDADPGEPAIAPGADPQTDAAQGEFEAPPPRADAWPETDQAGEAWPTEPPAAGSGDADTWPTRAPERDDEPAWEAAPSRDAEATAETSGEPAAEGYSERTYDEAAEQQHPPSEAEAYAPPAGVSAAGADDTAAVTASTAPAHSVPAASEMGESTQCPRCGTENRPGLAFCRNCGQRLVAAGVAATVERPGAPEGTMACPRCGTHNRAGVAFCQNCGANLRAVATPGYVPPAAAPAATDGEVATVVVEDGARAVLGPVVLLIGAAGMIAGWLLPFPYGSGSSLFERAFGTGGYGAPFWSGYPDVTGGLADQAYFGFAAPAPLFAALLLVLSIAGMVRARPGMLQGIGLVISLLWAIGLAALFVVVEVLGNAGGPITELLRALTPGGIIFFLASLIVLIGTLTRFARS